jgi:hypothetical protein
VQRARISSDFVYHVSVEDECEHKKMELLILRSRRNARKVADFRLTRKWKQLFEKGHESKSPDLYRDGIFRPIFMLLIARIFLLAMH